MTACERVGSMARLGQVFKMMRENDVEPNEIIYGAALSCCRKVGEAERAYTLLRKMMRDGLKPNVATFNTVLVALTKAQKMDSAVNVFKTLNAKSYTDASPNRQTYSILIRALAKNQPRKAEARLRRMRKQEEMVPDVDLYTEQLLRMNVQDNPCEPCVSWKPCERMALTFMKQVY